MVEAKKENEACRCPYCDADLDQHDPICSACTVTIVVCPICGKPLRQEQDCPECGPQDK